jgi:hypothetical protein
VLSPDERIVHFPHSPVLITSLSIFRACACTWPKRGAAHPSCCCTAFPNRWEWGGIVPGLASHYHVICPDMRGAGWTDAPPTGYMRGPRAR